MRFSHPLCPWYDLTLHSTKAWGEALDPAGSSGVSSFLISHRRWNNLSFETHTFQIRFLGDPTAKFTEALDLTFDGTAIFGGPRSKRYALEIEDGKVKTIHVEPDNTGVDGKPLHATPHQDDR